MDQFDPSNPNAKPMSEAKRNRLIRQHAKDKRDSDKSDGSAHSDHITAAANVGEGDTQDFLDETQDVDLQANQQHIGSFRTLAPGSGLSGTRVSFAAETQVITPAALDAALRQSSSVVPPVPILPPAVTTTSSSAEHPTTAAQTSTTTVQTSSTTAQTSTTPNDATVGSTHATPTTPSHHADQSQTATTGATVPSDNETDGQEEGLAELTAIRPLPVQSIDFESAPNSDLMDDARDEWKLRFYGIIPRRAVKCASDDLERFKDIYNQFHLKHVHNGMIEASAGLKSPHRERVRFEFIRERLVVYIVEIEKLRSLLEQWRADWRKSKGIMVIKVLAAAKDVYDAMCAAYKEMQEAAAELREYLVKIKNEDDRRAARLAAEQEFKEQDGKLHSLLTFASGLSNPGRIRMPKPAGRATSTLTRPTRKKKKEHMLLRPLPHGGAVAVPASSLPPRSSSRGRSQTQTQTQTQVQVQAQTQSQAQLQAQSQAQSQSPTSAQTHRIVIDQHPPPNTQTQSTAQSHSRSHAHSHSHSHSSARVHTRSETKSKTKTKTNRTGKSSTSHGDRRIQAAAAESTQQV